MWAKGFGSPSHDVSNSVWVDLAGNSYLTGIFSDVADLDPGAGATSFTSAGLEDIFIAKYDNAGDFVWAIPIGGTGSDYGNSIQVDGLGNVYVTGYFENTVDFDPGAGTVNLTSLGSLDAFIAKYDNNGNYIWAKQIGNSGNDIGQSLQIDPSGNIVFTGYFSSTVDFDANAGVVNLTSPGMFLDIFIAKYDNNGNYISAKNIGGPGNDVPAALYIDAAGSVYLTGTFQNTADFDPGIGTATLTYAGGISDIFMAKYDNTLNYTWAKKIGSGGDEGGNHIIADASGNVYLTGYYSGSVNFDPAGGTAVKTATALQDMFLAKYDNLGNYVWAHSFGGPQNDAGKYLQFDGTGNICLGANFTGIVDFDPGTENTATDASGQVSIIIAKYSTTGNFVKASGVGGISSSAFLNCMRIDLSDNICITGYFTGYVDFDMTNGFQTFLSSITHNDIFNAKYNNVPIGMSELKQDENSLVLSPNPNKGEFNLNTSFFIEEMEIEITDITGRKVYAGYHNGRSTPIQLTGLDKGIYNLKAFNKQLIFTKKLVIE